ncbi:MAG: hypothetical protein IJM57_07480, partial [Lachnospiraceae bacterium]|nr:hypothetical protein [Lachnospiraceae bacterium]
ILSQDQTLVKSLSSQATLASLKSLCILKFTLLKFASVARNFKTNFKVVSLFGFQGSESLQYLVFQRIEGLSQTRFLRECEVDCITGYRACQHIFESFFCCVFDDF